MQYDHTHRHLVRNERNTGHERMFLRFAGVQYASSLPSSIASANKMCNKLTIPLDDLARLIWSVQWIDNNVFSTVCSSDVTEMTLTAVPKPAYTLAAKRRCECRLAHAEKRQWRSISTSVAFKVSASAVAPSSPILLYWSLSWVIDVLAL